MKKLTIAAASPRRAGDRNRPVNAQQPGLRAPSCGPDLTVQAGTRGGRAEFIPGGQADGTRIPARNSATS